MPCFPRRHAAASLKLGGVDVTVVVCAAFSAASCRGLIEAPRARQLLQVSRCFPRRHAAASLKLAVEHERARVCAEFSAASCRGLIEADVIRRVLGKRGQFSAASCRGLIEAPPVTITIDTTVPVFRGVMPRPH